MSLSPTVSVVIVSYNTADWLARCLASIPAASTRHDVEVVVVDNASADGSADLVARDFPAVRLVRSDRNLGFGRAVNLGAADATGDYLLLLNPDGYLEPGALDNLVDFAEAHPEHVICGGRTVTPEGDLDPRSCWAAPSLWSLLCSALLLSTARPRSTLFDPEAMGDYARDEVRTVDIVTGCLLLIALADWRKLGGFDERYFLYGEDADLCLRAAETGRTCAITPDAVMVHAGGVSSVTTAAKQKLLLAGRITLVRTRWPGWRGRFGGALTVGGVGLRAAVFRLRHGRGAHWQETWRERHRWGRGYPLPPEEGERMTAIDEDVLDDREASATGRSSLRHGRERGAFFLRSLLDPRTYVHALRLLHYYHYTHVAEVGKLHRGHDVRLAPNVSLSHAERIALGDRSRIGAGTSLWAGEVHGRITIGSETVFAPECFLTASNYGIEAGTVFLDQAKHEADITVGDGVWFGTGVVVLAGVTIGDGTIVAAGAVVTHDLPANVIAGGVPAKVLRER
jgi:GT2 family glycosyltransferase/acetyltransferase-like isoleucine patch superfamily enzyme